MSRRKSSSSSSKSSPPKRSAQSSGWGGLLEARQWDKVCDAANSTTAFECDARGRTFLHGACAADAPIHVIEKLMEINEADADGQLPFHSVGRARHFVVRRGSRLKGLPRSDESNQRDRPDTAAVCRCQRK